VKCPCRYSARWTCCEWTLARGVPIAGPYWVSPRGGKAEVRWMERTRSYRFTLDLRPPLPFPDAD